MHGVELGTAGDNGAAILELHHRAAGVLASSRSTPLSIACRIAATAMFIPMFVLFTEFAWPLHSVSASGKLMCYSQTLDIISGGLSPNTDRVPGDGYAR
jgi:hypothetical protein